MGQSILTIINLGINVYLLYKIHTLWAILSNVLRVWAFTSLLPFSFSAYPNKEFETVYVHPHLNVQLVTMSFLAIITLLAIIAFTYYVYTKLATSAMQTVNHLCSVNTVKLLLSGSDGIIYKNRCNIPTVHSDPDITPFLLEKPTLRIHPCLNPKMDLKSNNKNRIKILMIIKLHWQTALTLNWYVLLIFLGKNSRKRGSS